MVLLYFHLRLLLLFHIVRRMSVLSSSLFVLAPVYHSDCSLVLLHFAVSSINKQQTYTTNKANTFLSINEIDKCYALSAWFM